ncbi:F-box domain-containing protein [Mycena venus]|uniref:F-box domain-containing protein n=1 Tax=Mycena venus TaxID=2733690 RepID=A0A8H6Y7U9_9AGAR|nr:F-box domain-containing protein [Mycena venus]
MTIHFLDLPSEILVLILYYLDLPSLIACLATNRRVKSIIDGSSFLQYRMAAQAACVEDNPCGDTTMTSAQRLVALQKRQRAFAELLPSSIRTIPVDNASDILSTFYMLSGGIFAYRDSSMKALRWISLSSNERQSPVWQRLELDEYILVFQLAVPEENLLVVVSSYVAISQFINTSVSLNPSTVPLHANTASDAIIKLRLYEMSTRSAHPAAQEPVMNVPIAGTDWTLLVTCRLLVYDWKLGRLQMVWSQFIFGVLFLSKRLHKDLDDHYSAAVFLSTEVILLARAVTGSLELWNLEDGNEPKVVLKLPHIPDHCEYHVNRVESNPKGSHASASRLPFHSSFIDSLVVLQVLLITNQIGTTRQDMFLVIPRHALLQQIPSSELCGKERLWVDWGPPVSRWLSDYYTFDWPTIICGQRCVFRTFDGSMLLLDFNPYAHKRFLLEQAEVKHDDGGRVDDRSVFLGAFMGVALDIPNEEEMLSASSRLGYVAKKPGVAINWDGVMMDEEWIVGIKNTTESDGKFSLEVWHLG